MAALKASGLQQGLYYEKNNVDYKSYFKFLSSNFILFFFSEIGIFHAAKSWHSTGTQIRSFIFSFLPFFRSWQSAACERGRSFQVAEL